MQHPRTPRQSIGPRGVAILALVQGDAWRWALAVVAGLTILRLGALFLTPIQLYPDEAQYWVWSRQMAWGYFSKPPMIAWLVRLTTDIGGQGEAWVRVSSVLLHGAAPLFLFHAARRLYDARVALLAVLLYSLMPGVQLSSGVASTDAPLLFFLSVVVWAYVRLLDAPPSRAAGWGALAGLLLGLAFLSKYAAVYALIGLVIHALVAESARRAWRPRVILCAAAALILVVAANFGWNAHNGFATFAHTARNADWTSPSLFHPLEVLDFGADQAAVFGPVPLAVLVTGCALGIRRRRLGGPDSLLLSLALPPLVLVTVQALLSRANANWAFTAYAPGSILAAAWLVRWRARGWTFAALGLQGAFCLLFLAAAIQPVLADAAGLSNSLKRARGWREATAAVLDRADSQAGLSAIAVDDRFLFNELSYYGRQRLARPGAVPLRMWVREGRPMNHAEMTAPLQEAQGGSVLMIGRTPAFARDFIGDFRAVRRLDPIEVPLDRRRSRRFDVMLGSEFAPRPRDPLSGLPNR